ncbi:MAG: alpha/beta hydrolase, partial [Actinobacteria bacterium]|nr:alpha/beta hydrolase [Actinomycetota bacterium]
GCRAATMALVRVVTDDGVELAVHDLGGSGPPLVLAHPTGFHGRVFEPLAAALADRFRCWSYDSRGHGDSGRPEASDYPWHEFALDVLAVVDGLELERPSAMGHSQGGTALLLAEQARPGTFSGLYVYEPVAFPPDEAAASMDEHPLVVGALRRRAEFDSIDAVHQHLAPKPILRDLHPGALRAYVEHGFGPAPGGGVTLKCRREDEAQMYRQGRAHDAFSHLAEVTCPVTLARGASDSAHHSPELADRQVALLPAGRLEVFDGLGHLGPLEDPARVAESMARALLPA